MWWPSALRRYSRYVAALAVFLLVALFVLSPSARSHLDRLRRDFMAQSLVRKARSEVERSRPDLARAARLAGWATELSPQSLPVLRGAAGVFLQARAWDRAAKTLLALGGLTGHLDTYRLGMCYLYLGEEKAGVLLLENHVSTQRSLHATGRLGDFQLAAVLNDVGYVYADTGVRLREALALTQEAVRRVPLNGNLLDSLGWAYFRLGQYEQAAFYLERALRQSREPSADILYHAGVVHARQGRLLLGRHELQRALALRAEFPEAEAELRRMHWQLPRPEPV